MTLPDLIQFATPHLLLVVGFIIGLALVAHIVRQQIHPGSSIAWLFAIIVIPYLAVPLYLLVGGRKLRRLKQSDNQAHKFNHETSNDTSQAVNPANLLANHGTFPMRHNNQLSLLDSNGEAYRQLLNEIDQATDSIHIMVFILGNDDVGRTVIDHLSEKAKQGVNVKLLVDAWGSFYARFGLIQKLRKAGGEVAIFMPILPYRRRWSTNLRNHRKLAIFDNQVAFIGGMNIGRQYMSFEQNDKLWIDTMTRVEGPAVQDLNNVFSHDWHFATDERLAETPEKKDTFNSKPSSTSTSQENQSAHIIISGPDVAGEPIYDALLAAIYNATRKIWIVTPYFAPDYGLVRALKFMAMQGIDVRLIMPLKSNHRIADFARNRLLRELKATGVKIYLHPTRMIHAKHVVIDDVFSVSGSVNIDIRSFYYNYEVALYTDTASATDNVSNWITTLCEQSKDGEIPKLTTIRRWSEDFCWLLSPLI